jgi:hypothetical protein
MSVVCLNAVQGDMVERLNAEIERLQQESSALKDKVCMRDLSVSQAGDCRLVGAQGAQVQRGDG